MTFDKLQAELDIKNADIANAIFFAKGTNRYHHWKKVKYGMSKLKGDETIQLLTFLQEKSGKSKTYLATAVKRCIASAND